MKVYCTKYALTRGILLVDGEQRSPASWDSVVQIKSPVHGTADFLYYYEWYDTWGSAVARAQDMRERRIKSLEKQIAKLKALEFKKPEGGRA